MSGSYTGFPIANVAVPSLPDLGGVTDGSMMVGERAGTGRFAVTALRDYVMTTVGAGYVPLAGAVMTGPLTLSGPPVAPSHAATMAYVDAGDTTRLPLSGGTLTGPLTVGGNGIVYGTVPAGNRHTHAFGYDGTRLISYVDGINVGNVAVGDYLLLTGGTLTGGLTIGSGALSVSGTIGSNGLIAAAGDIYARGGHYYFGNADQAVLNTSVAGTSLRFSADGWALSWNASTGTLGYINNSSLALFTVDSGGNGTFLGAVHGTNVTLLEDKVAELQARIADLEGNISARITALEARMGTGTAD